MKLHLTPSTGLQLFSGYGADYVSVNNVRHETSVVVTPEAVTEWNAVRVDTLTAANFGFIADLNPEIVLLGTGATQRFPPPELARALAVSGVGLEVMDSRAACRTYNILATEGRKVVAAILLD
ncbi:MAG TPA: Mth938-like domain-containing protein [Burkholderiales bacterium]|jgi:uncharacterized protein|nr:Mth938-like domain-containing protein [Burkholderiales bacterium]